MLRRTLLKGAVGVPFGTSRAQGFNNTVVSLFEAGDTVIDRHGIRVYNGTPGPNNLAISLNSNTPYADKFGNQIPAGDTIFGEASPPGPGVGTATNVGFNGITSWLANSSGANSQQGSWSQVQTFAQTASATVTSQGISAQEPGGSAITPEVWHAVTVPTGMTGSIRVKLSPVANFAILDINVVITSTLTTGQTYTMGNLPSAAYYPTAIRQYPLTVNQGMGTSPSAPRALIVTSGASSILTPGFTTAGNTCIMSGTIEYPLD